MVYGCDIERKVQSSQQVSEGDHLTIKPRPHKKARQVQSNIKAMLTVFLILRALFTMSFSTRQESEQGYYLEVMKLPEKET